MHNFERNKIMGAVFGALLILMVVKVSAHVIFSVPEADPKSFIVVDADSVPGGGNADQAPPPELPLSFLLENAKPELGAKEARACQACHNLQEGAGAKVGPDLYKVVGRPVATAPGFSYSQAMQKHASQVKVWSFEALFNFLKNPREEVPGTLMTFGGIPDAQKRANLIAYLNTLGSNLPFPKPTEQDKEQLNKIQKEQDTQSKKVEPASS